MFSAGGRLPSAVRGGIAWLNGGLRGGRGELPNIGLLTVSVGQGIPRVSRVDGRVTDPLESCNGELGINPVDANETAMDYGVGAASYLKSNLTRVSSVTDTGGERSRYAEPQGVHSLTGLLSNVFARMNPAMRVSETLFGMQGQMWGSIRVPANTRVFQGFTGALSPCRPTGSLTGNTVTVEAFRFGEDNPVMEARGARETRRVSLNLNTAVHDIGVMEDLHNNNGTERVQ
ncbi:hypothetical protein NE237_030664 [Protea cynaroides]|uniref:Uncharacterized protein n=1 Tax=Protea cynaroides TaxID=273540 RepID=A0A9Q0GXM5_9MAGN|nr:hypothetical protein NE237_030664 [Protea cynaroides]